MLTPPLPPAFTELLSSSSLDLKQRMLTALSKDIAHAKLHATPTTSTTTPTESNNDLSCFTEHVEDLGIDDTLSKAIWSELQSLRLRSRSRKGKLNKVKTQWLSPSNEEYNYGNVINKPMPISNFPNICKLGEIVNKHSSTTGDMDAALVSCFSTSNAHLRLHSDMEPLISQSSSICTVSFGPPRTLEFVRIGKLDLKGNNDLTADLSIPATHLSMNIMKPGCQSVLKHRVPEGVHQTGECNIRYSISWRKIVRPDAPPTTSIISPNIPNEDSTLAPDKAIPSPKPSQAKESVVLLAGDSFFARLEAPRLAKKNKTVINIAKGGSKIDTVLKSIEDFVDKNPTKEVKQLFVSIGTNDIRYCTDGIKHLKTPVSNFMKTTKALLPNTEIFIQSLLPIAATKGSPHTERNVLLMNKTLFNLCSRYKLFYIDAFSLFLDFHGRRKLSLFPAFDAVNKYIDIHPNARGFGVLARMYIFLINHKKFNPLGY